MSELALLPAFTSAGLAAIAAAHGQGLSLKITHLAFGDVAYDVRDGNGVPLAAARARLALSNERVRVAVAAGNAVTANSILVVGELPAAIPEFWIKEVGFFAEDGTLVAVWSMADQTLGWRGANAPWLFKFVLSWTDLPPNAITVVFDGDATLSALATDMSRLEAKVRHTVMVRAGLGWDELDETLLSDALDALIAAATPDLSGYVLTSTLKALAYLDVGYGIEPDGTGKARVKLNGNTLRREIAGLSLNLDNANTWASAQRGAVVALVDDFPVTPNFALANNFTLWLGGNRTLGNPANLTAGQSGAIAITQDAVGGRTLAFGSCWKFAGGAAPSLTTTANAVDVLAYYVESANRITGRLIKDVR